MFHLCTFLQPKSHNQPHHQKHHELPVWSSTTTHIQSYTPQVKWCGISCQKSDHTSQHHSYSVASTISTAFTLSFLEVQGQLMPQAWGLVTFLWISLVYCAFMRVPQCRGPGLSLNTGEFQFEENPSRWCQITGIPTTSTALRRILSTAVAEWLSVTTIWDITFQLKVYLWDHIPAMIKLKWLSIHKRRTSSA